MADAVRPTGTLRQIRTERKVRHPLKANRPPLKRLPGNWRGVTVARSCSMRASLRTRYPLTPKDVALPHSDNAFLDQLHGVSRAF